MGCFFCIYVVVGRCCVEFLFDDEIDDFFDCCFVDFVFGYVLVFIYDLNLVVDEEKVLELVCD